MAKRLRQNKKGFTLVEIMVGVVIFSIMIGAISGLFSSSLRAQRRSLATEEVLGQSSYALEYMSRALRMAKKELFSYPVHCLSNFGYNYENTAGDTAKIRFIKFDYDQNQDACYEFSLAAGLLQETKTNLQTGVATSQTLTSADLQISQLKFHLVGQSQNDDLQPRVTIVADVTGKQNVEIKIQTSISQRNLDVAR